ncbi:MAG: N-acylneuraminate cytidylyltransferase [Bacteroidales bacterium]|nr:N-acylneuraminate cytidylyltransferase [Bacteroidales bacterium]
MSVISFVPIRSGSKSIKDKNIKLFYGKPLIYWVLSSLQNAYQIDKIVVALDSQKYASIVNDFGFSKVEIFHRDTANSTDTSLTIDVVLEYMANARLKDEDIFMIAQATSPLTTSNDFDSAVKQFVYSAKDSMLSCVKIKRFFWNTDGTPVNYDYKNRPRRQDFDGSMYMENGAFYISRVSSVITEKNFISGGIEVYVMSENTALELDEPPDWKIGEILMSERENVTKSIKTEIKLFLSDVDGVLTDAGMYYSEKGDELKKFCTYDGMGFKILQEKGIKVGIITGEDRELNRARARKLKLDFDFHGETNKLETVTKICSEAGISLSEVAYIGDDINDFELLSNVGLAACPANAVQKIKNIPDIIHLEKSGGEGAVREFAEIIMNCL